MSSEVTPNSAPSSIELIGSARRTLEGVIGIPATEGNRVTVLRNGCEIFPAMLDAIRGAEHTIDFLTFVYWKGEIGIEMAEALGHRASAGVRVRVLLDAWGSKPIERHLIDDMIRAGVQLRWFRPLGRVRLGEVNHRTHRKVLVVDESVAFTGGVGISDLWMGDARNEHEWRDTHFKVEGPTVDGLRAAFLDNWAETDAPIFDTACDRFPSQPTPGQSVIQCVRGASAMGGSDLASVFRALLQLTQRQLRVTTAYFVPDHDLTKRLCNASERGVRVQILLPGPYADKRFVQLAAEADYEQLIESGVELWNFQPSMMHAKTMTVDGQVANVGSANFNSRSLNCDEEINMVIFDRSIVGTLDRHFDDDLQRSVRIDPSRWKRRSLLQRVQEKLVAPLRGVS
ncbi:MAG TPA: phospholipase D-like domain-containing protein [Acidimicrobiales bacterium]|nr:phospholipase D-like domain-containing protein [Acidimicrobiales bacterium]